MGGGMAANLVKAGHRVNAFDLSADALARAQENGCATFTSVRDAVDGVDAVVSMLPNGSIVDSVFAADVLGHAPTGAGDIRHAGVLDFMIAVLRTDWMCHVICPSWSVRKQPAP